MGPRGKSQEPPLDDEEEEDEARTSRLFYLQLYSSVLKAANEEKQRFERTSKAATTSSSTPSRRSTRLSKAVRSMSWKDVTDLLSSKRRKKRRFSPRETEEQEVDVIFDDSDSGGGANTETTMVTNSRASDRRRILDEPGQQGQPSSRKALEYRGSAGPKKLEPVLNIRMKELASGNFSMRQRRDERTAVVAERQRTCHLGWTRMIQMAGRALIAAVAAVTAVLILVGSSTGAYYQLTFDADPFPAKRPGVAVCLPTPFSSEKLRRSGVSPPLASFMLYTLSPFYANRHILEKRDLLENLSGQYGRLLPDRKRRRARRELLKWLRQLAPKCSDVVAGCDVGADSMLAGDECCREIFSRSEYTLRHGLCFTAPHFGRLLGPVDAESRNGGEFPLRTPHATARLTVFLDSAPLARATADLRPSNVPAFRLLVLTGPRASSESFHGEDDRVLDVVEGATAVVAISKQVEDRRHPLGFLSGSSCSSAGEAEDEEDVEIQAEERTLRRWKRGPTFVRLQSAHRSNVDCRSEAVQAIAEKSVNCSLLALPPQSIENVACGPLESLALAYILREQGSLVSIDPAMLNTFEDRLSDVCPPPPCVAARFKPAWPLIKPGVDVASLPRRSTRTPPNRRAFPPLSLSALSAVEVSYRPEELLATRRLRFGWTDAFSALAILCGAASAMLLALDACGRLASRCSKRKRLRFKHEKGQPA